ncbi:putative serine/threonine-protein kinase PBL28 [Bidens hawaiensis]|uniref:putative serine/threonine-protein kinase PBL28 n=1 Tax=Bidens hawaiensis TaxID=980011 RepID=UPI00404B9D6E
MKLYISRCLLTHCSRVHLDPEYVTSGRLKRESDVYSFGVILFEILCGRLADDPIYLKESSKGLAHVARQSFNTGTIEEMIDPIIKEETNEHNCFLIRGPNKDSLHTFIKIAHQCVAETQDKRPTMKVVVKQLKKALFFQENNKDSLRIPLEDIKQATQNFHDDNCIGEGGFGKIYKGNLQDGDEFKTIVAKQLDTRHGQVEKQFLSELQILWEYKHESVMGLVGYCDELEEKIIVYEYAPRGSLDRYLNDASLTWMKRLNICIGVASALDFIHGGVGKQTKVIHGDIKTANILLNHDSQAKLAGFGLSLISPVTTTLGIEYVIDYACGTPGCMDPLYKKSGYLTIESDVYSFGVVMFEILCGRSTFVTREHEGHYLPEFIKNIFEEGKQNEVVFEQIREHIVPESLATFQEIAYQCLHVEIEKRPTTKEVLMQLKIALEFQVPTKPKVNDQSVINIEETVINIEETISADDIDQPNLDTNESDKCLDISESQKKEVEDYVHAYRSPAKEVFMNWTSRQWEYFVVLCRELQINPEDMDDEEEVAS